MNLKPGVMACAQAAVDDLMFPLACYALKMIGEHNLCVANGMGLHSVTNSRRSRLLVTLCNPMPAPHDADVALGATLHVGARMVC
ncbi:hypothetical protein [Mycobacterium lepromatosis]|uniref:hypothetical protein n=1 Tax=Mycobacterium lepromatosis TaxID=480418 RepID=UPI00138DE179|nr:hypothetical protein [Mycobacterium lepromatosis]